MRRAFGFLMWAKEHRRVSEHLIGVGPDFQVRIEVRNFTSKAKKRGVTKRQYLHHDAIPKLKPAPHPPTATTHEVDALWEAASEFATAFRKHRAFLILDLLEVTGVRRSELVAITLTDLKSASVSGSLRIKSAKKDSASVREVPIQQDSLDRANRFVEQFRSEAIAKGRRTDKHFQNHDFLFVTHRGRPYSERSVTSEFKTLREKADLSRNIHPHSLRRRFNSRLRMAASQSTDISKGLPDGYKLIHKAIMGWKSDEMLEVYFDQNLAEIEKGVSFHSLLEQILSDQALRKKLLDLRAALQNDSTSIDGLSNTEAAGIIDSILLRDRQPSSGCTDR
jgi:integrase